MNNINTCYFCSSTLISAYGLSCCQNEHPRLRVSTNGWITLSAANITSDLTDPSFPLIIWRAPGFLKAAHTKDGLYSYMVSKASDEIDISEGKFNFEQLESAYHKMMKLKVFL